MASKPRLGYSIALALAFVLTLPAARGAHAQPNGTHAPADNSTVELMVGEQRVLPATGVKTYSEGVRGVIDVRLTSDGSRFVVVGVARGTTTLLLIMVDGSERLITINVKDPREQGEAKPANAMAVMPQASVRLDLYFVQVSRSRSTELGMSVPSSVGFGEFIAHYSIPSASLIQKSAVVGTDFLPRLDMAQSRGWAKIRRHVAVITTNGTQANFDSGGEFNALSVNGLSSAVVSIKFGTNLSIQPRYDAATGRIELAIQAQVADLTPGSPLPGRTQSTVNTVANLALGESLAVAGLVAGSRERSRTGIPYLSQIPVLGLLFGKQADKESDTENLVFIAPSVVEPLTHARAKELLSNALREYDAYSGGDVQRQVFPGTPWVLPNQRPASAP